MAATAALVLCAGCGDGEPGAAEAREESPTTAAPTTAAPTTAAPTTAAPTTTSPTAPASTTWAEVPAGPCPAEPPYGSPPEWLLDEVPSDLVVTSAVTWTWSSAADSSGPSETHVLIERGADGTVARTIQLHVVDAPATEYYSTPLEGAAVIDEVRSLPGTITTFINRGNRGWLAAEWQEGGRHWRANADVSVGADGLAEALRPLDLASAPISDPSGTFELIGTDAVDGPLPDRAVVIDLAEPGAREGGPTVSVAVRWRGAGSSGTRLPEQALGARVEEVEGRRVAVAPNGGAVVAEGSDSTLVEVTSMPGGPEVDLVDLALAAVLVDPAGEQALAAPAGAEGEGAAVCRPG